MKALKFYAAGDVRYEDAEEPAIQKNDEVKIRIKTAGICGSDISRYIKLGPYVAGMIWGHEFSGEVTAVGNAVHRFKVGDRVTACPTFYCGSCEFCKRGEFARCGELSVIGAYVPGSFAEYIVLPEENIVAVPAQVDDDTAAMVEPSAVVVHGYHKTGIAAGDTVTVVGCGTIGLLAVQWAKVLGAKQVIAVDIDDAKLSMARALGADYTVNSTGREPFEEIYHLTEKRGTDIVVESAGTPITSAQAFSFARKGGKVIFLGIPYGDVLVKRLYFEKIVRNELQIFGS